MAELELALLLMPGTQTNCCMDRRGVCQRKSSWSSNRALHQGTQSSPGAGQRVYSDCERPPPTAHLAREGDLQKCKKVDALPQCLSQHHPLNSMRISDSSYRSHVIRVVRGTLFHHSRLDRVVINGRRPDWKSIGHILRVIAPCVQRPTEPQRGTTLDSATFTSGGGFHATGFLFSQLSIDDRP